MTLLKSLLCAVLVALGAISMACNRPRHDIIVEAPVAFDIRVAFKQGERGTMDRLETGERRNIALPPEIDPSKPYLIYLLCELHGIKGHGFANRWTITGLPSDLAFDGEDFTTLIVNASQRVEAERKISDPDPSSGTTRTAETIKQLDFTP